VPTLKPEAVKDLRGAHQGPAEIRTRIIRLIEQMTCGRWLLVCMHGAGPPFADKMVIGRYTEMEEKKKLAKEIAGIER
jgi:4-hydroxybutyryl-CoA dehydratase/vinylacetyl-CoA-Delta-isomerase